MANDQTDHRLHPTPSQPIDYKMHTHTFTIILSLSWVYLFFASKTRKTIYRNLTRSNIFYYFHSFVTHFSLLLLCLCACRCLFRTFSIPKKIFYIYKYCQRNPVCYIFIMLLLSWLLCSSFFAHCSAMLGLLSVDLCFSFTFHGKKEKHLQDLIFWWFHCFYSHRIIITVVVLLAFFHRRLSNSFTCQTETTAIHINHAKRVSSVPRNIQHNVNESRTVFGVHVLKWLT